MRDNVNIGFNIWIIMTTRKSSINSASLSVEKPQWPTHQTAATTIQMRLGVSPSVG